MSNLSIVKIKKVKQTPHSCIKLLKNVNTVNDIYSEATTVLSVRITLQNVCV